MLLGCERLGKARQCQKLAETVNEAMAQIGTQGSDTLSEERLREAAELYERLARELGPMEFSEKELALEVASLNRILVQAATTTTNLADAAAGDERAQASLIKRELGSLGSQMRLQGSKIDRTCRAH
jgi:hypothetical protein